MKKVILSILALILTVSVLAPVAAYASTTQETEITAFVKKQDKVTDANCLVYENNCIVAIKTEKFVSKSDYDQFRDNLKKQLESKYDFEHLVITRSPKAMHAIEEISKLSESEREQAIKDFINKFTPKHPVRPPIEPRH